MEMVMPYMCESCAFTNICLPMEKDTRNFDGLCEDFSWPDEIDKEKEVQDIEDSHPPFIHGRRCPTTC